MTILSAQSIRKLCKTIPFLITPFHEKTKFEGRSFGLSECGYDIRIAQTIWVWPLWGRLASSMEEFNIPNYLCAEVKDKSTNARLMLTVQNTICEPGWYGYLTLELTRHKPWPIRIKKGTPIAQMIFKKLDEPTESPYKGKYNGQPYMPVAAIMEK